MGMGDRLLTLYPVNVTYEDVTFDDKKDIVEQIGQSSWFWE